MTTTKTIPTHLILDRNSRVIDSGTDVKALEDDFAASLSLGESRLVELATTDLPTLAAIAIADRPALNGQYAPAAPYLQAMRRLYGVDATNVRTASFGQDRAVDVVRYFLNNVASWRGDTARAVKALLKGWVA